MDRDTIVMQLKDVPNSMFWVISGREMAKDLQPLMADGEVVQWFSEALEKNVGHFFANGRRGLRCYTVVTNRKFYYITRGRKDLNLIKAIDKTVVIPVEEQTPNSKYLEKLRAALRQPWLSVLSNPVRQFW